MMRLRRVPRRIGSEHLVRQLFLPLRHRVVEVVEGRDQLLQMLDVCFGHLHVGLHVLHRVHCRVLLSALQESLIHIAGVFAHDLGELIPLRLLGRRDLQLRVQLFDMVLDSFPCSCPKRAGTSSARMRRRAGRLVRETGWVAPAPRREAPAAQRRLQKQVGSTGLSSSNRSSV
jgi:hypothetical protein